MSLTIDVASPTVYLVSGANRGIGLALVTALLVRGDVIVFAGARDPSSATSLRALEAQHPGKLHIVQLTSANREDNEAAVATIKEVAGYLDVVIANAGIHTVYLEPLDATLEAMREHFEVNTLGPLVLFQATYELLKASKQTPKFIIISSLLGSAKVGSAMPIPVTPYGASKAAVDWIAARMWHKYPEIVTVPISPGVVETDMAKIASKSVPYVDEIQKMTPQECAAALLQLIDKATRGEEPKMLDYDGSVVPW